MVAYKLKQTAVNDLLSDITSLKSQVELLNTSVVHKNGDETISGKKTFTQPIDGAGMYAYWGDLAEVYSSDKNYPRGTLLQFGGDREVTIATKDVNFVVSDNPAFLINNGESDKFEYPVKVALIGRVQVLVTGQVKKFDRIKLSNIPGVANRCFLNESAIGVCLEDKNSEELGLVLCSVKLKF